MEECLYKTRVSLWNLDIFLYFVIDVFAWFIHYILGILFFVLLVGWIVSVVGMRIYVYKDRIEYKAGFIFKTFSKSMPINKATTITYSSDLLGKIFSYGDIVIGTYNDLDGFRLKGVKNAKMLCENIKSLMYDEVK